MSEKTYLGNNLYAKKVRGEAVLSTEFVGVKNVCFYLDRNTLAALAKWAIAEGLLAHQPAAVALEGLCDAAFTFLSNADPLPPNGIELSAELQAAIDAGREALRHP